MDGDRAAHGYVRDMTKRAEDQPVHRASVELRRDLHRTAMQAAQVRTPCPWCGRDCGETLCPQPREPRCRRVRSTPRGLRGVGGLFGLDHRGACPTTQGPVSVNL
jgi:hypothetical protein